MTKRDVAQIVLYNDVSEFYLQHRDDDPNIYHPGTIGLFGGGIEPNETPLQAVIRECFEETDYKLKNPQLFDKNDPFGKGLRWVFIEKYDSTFPLICREGKKGEWLSWKQIEPNPKILAENKRILKKLDFEIRKT